MQAPVDENVRQDLHARAGGDGAPEPIGVVPQRARQVEHPDGVEERLPSHGRAQEARGDDDDQPLARDPEPGLGDLGRPERPRLSEGTGPARDPG